MKEEHGNVILKRIKKRLRGLVACLMAAALMVGATPGMNAFAGEEPDNYYFVMYTDGDPVALCSGKESVENKSIFDYFNYSGNNGYIGNQSTSPYTFLGVIEGSPMTQIGMIEKDIPSSSYIISPDTDVTVYFGATSGGQMKIMLNGESKGYNSGTGKSNKKSFTLPKGKYSVRHTSDEEYINNYNYTKKRWIIEINSMISEISFSETDLEFTVGDGAKTLTVLPEGAKVTWTTSDKNVASVDSGGKVIPVGPGKATITATLNDDETVSAKCEVIVSAKSEDVPVHTHTFVYKEAKEATYTEAGYEDHYECTECHMWAKDANGNYIYSEEEMKELIIPPKTKPNEGGSSSSGSSSSSSSSDSDSDSESSGGGSRGKSGSVSQKSIDVNGNTVQTQPDSGAPLSDRGGNWGNQEHIWTYTKSDGSLAKGEWLNLEYDGHTYWYYFDDSTIMQTNWFDYNGSRYFLVPEMDGWRGRMATGWHMVDNKWYYFEPTIGANQGILYRGMTTPDGHTVGADGAWDGNGTTSVGAIHTGTTVTMN